MNTFLDPIWAAFDADEAFGADYVSSWPPGALDWLLRVQLVKRAANATQITCPDCPDRHVEEIESVVISDDVRRFYVKCPESMRAWVDESAPVQYQPDFQMLARQIKEQLNIEGRVTNKIMDRLWRIGFCTLPKAKREIYMARRLNGVDISDVISAIPKTGGPIVLIGGTSPRLERLPSRVPTLVQLQHVLRASDSGVDLDAARLVELAVEWDKVIKEQPGNTEVLNVLVNSAVERRFVEGPTLGLIADGVVAGKSTRGIAAEMKKRGVSCHHSTVARKISRAKKSYPPSATSHLNFRIDAFQFDSRVVDLHLPVDAFLTTVHIA